jgi:hypothetical protein
MESIGQLEHGGGLGQIRSKIGAPQDVPTPRHRARCLVICLHSWGDRVAPEALKRVDTWHDSRAYTRSVRVSHATGFDSKYGPGLLAASRRDRL